MKLRQQIHRIFKRRSQSSQVSPKNQGGFTLTELLVVILIAGIIVSALMGLVVELIGTEQRESSRTETQRSMQRALNYITSELEQAVYIYDSDPHPDPTVNQNQPSYMSFLPEKFEDEDYRPVIAFWKPKPLDVEAASKPPGKLPEYSECDTEFDGNSDQEQRLKRECRNLWKQRRAYSLVVYFQVPKGVANNNGKWDGESRIVRYELPKFNNLDATTNSADAFNRTPGFVDPAELGGSSFASWPFSEGQNCQTATGANACVEGLNGSGRPILNGGQEQVLVDFVDNPDEPRGNSDGTASEPIDCVDANRYDRVPDPQVVGQAKSSNSFFICLQNTGTGFGEPQDVIVYIRGNAKGRGGNKSDAFLPTLQTRVAMRGVIDKDIGASRRSANNP